jgi:hypothetical protein
VTHAWTVHYHLKISMYSSVSQPTSYQHNLSQYSTANYFLQMPYCRNLSWLGSLNNSVRYTTYIKHTQKLHTTQRLIRDHYYLKRQSLKSVLHASGYSLQDVRHLRLSTKNKRPHNVTTLPMTPSTASPRY